jgi:hypothetical protein
LRFCTRTDEYAAFIVAGPAWSRTGLESRRPSAPVAIARQRGRRSDNRLEDQSSVPLPLENHAAPPCFYCAGAAYALDSLSLQTDSVMLVL